jgi:alkyl sulfatase BDS1-like metallo-beta-lactamase superfamily hydrolase
MFLTTRREVEMNKSIVAISVALSAVLFSAGIMAAGGGAAPVAAAVSSGTHFHPKGKPPSEHTLKVLEAAHKTLPFSDTRDFDEEEKGFIAAPESWTIRTSTASIPHCSASRR